MSYKAEKLEGAWSQLGQLWGIQNLIPLLLKTGILAVVAWQDLRLLLGFGQTVAAAEEVRSGLARGVFRTC